MSNDTPTVLVTGGAGFIGSNLSDRLLREGARVRILDNFSTGFRENLNEISGDFDLVEGDVADPAVRFGFRVAHEEERVTHG